MGKLIIFNFVTLNGFYKGLNGDVSWKVQGADEDAYALEGLKSDNILVFGRVTYEMMAGYWPSENALKNNPLMAEGMNKAEKIVFSKTLKKADWNNTRIVSDNIFEEIIRLKETSKKDMAVMGSGSIVTQFAERNLIDEYSILVDPVAIGDGTPIFKGIDHKIDFKLTGTRTFKSGAVLLSYQAK